MRAAGWTLAMTMAVAAALAGGACGGAEAVRRGTISDAGPGGAPGVAGAGGSAGSTGGAAGVTSAGGTGGATRDAGADTPAGGGGAAGAGIGGGGGRGGSAGSAGLDSGTGARTGSDAGAGSDARAGAALPFGVDELFTASGYMGDGVTAGGITDVPACSARQGNARGRCHRFIWTPGAMGWAGIFWQFPEGNWGTQPGLAIAPGAQQVSFYAWGAAGGERISFFAGMTGVDAFSVQSPDVALTNVPTQITLDLRGVAYGAVVGPFGWTTNGSTAPVTFFLDDIEWR